MRSSKSSPLDLIHVETLSEREALLTFYVLSKPDVFSGVSLQSYYEGLAYGYAEAENLKIVGSIEVELNPKNDGARMVFRVKTYNKNKHFGFFKHQKRHYRAG